MAERLDAKAIHTGLIEQIKAWEFQPDFKQSNRQKLNRSLNLLAGTDPHVLVNLLGVKDVPANPRDAMNLIRGLDLKTLKKLEIFTGGDMKLGDKIVGHHRTAANTIGEALAGMSPEQRMKVYDGIRARGEKIGMDPRQIMQIWDDTHKEIAHGGDFTGKKTGAFLGYIAGEDADGFLERFDKSVDIQRKMADAAAAMPSNRILKGGIQGASEAAGIIDVSDPNTPIDYKGQATTLFSNFTNPIRDILKTSQSPDEAFQRVGSLISEGVENLPTRSKNLLAAMQAARPELGKIPIKGAVAGGIVGGAKPGFADVGTLQKATQGDVAGVAADVGVSAATGGLIEAGLQGVGRLSAGLANAARFLYGNVAGPAFAGTAIAGTTFADPKVQKKYAEAEPGLPALGAAFSNFIPKTDKVEQTAPNRSERRGR